MGSDEAVTQIVGITHTVPDTGTAVRTASTTILMDRCVKPTVRVYREPIGWLNCQRRSGLSQGNPAKQLGVDGNNHRARGHEHLAANAGGRRIPC